MLTKSVVVRTDYKGEFQQFKGTYLLLTSLYYSEQANDET